MDSASRPNVVADIRRHDRMLLRIFEYLSATLHFGHDMTVYTDDIRNISVTSCVDADLGGCPDTKRSTTGVVTGLSGDMTDITLETGQCGTPRASAGQVGPARDNRGTTSGAGAGAGGEDFCQGLA